MKQTHENYYQQQEDVNRLIELLATKEKLEEKTRINLYLPKIIVRLMDSLAGNVSRGKLVSRLIIKEVKKSKKFPFGIFPDAQISQLDIDEVTASWQRTVNEIS